MGVLFGVVIPVFAIILCGFLAGRMNLLPHTSASSLNSFVYYFALPALLFSSLASAPVDQITNIDFILANLFIVLSCFILTVVIFKLVFKKAFPELSMYGMMTSYGNTGFLGIPLLVAAFGQKAAVPAAMATFIYDLAIITIVIVSFELAKAMHRDQAERDGALQMVVTVVKSILFNPINASLILGALVALLQLPLPGPVVVFTEVLGPAAGPAALFALGLGLTGEQNALKNKAVVPAEFMTLLTLKLIVLPLLAIGFIYYVFPIENDLWATSVVILSATPTGALVYVFADKYNALVKQVPVFILVSTLVSMVTISGFLVWSAGI